MDDGQEILVVGEQTVFTLKDWVLSDHLFHLRIHLAMARKDSKSTTLTPLNTNQPKMGLS